jgi:hypothetical protein
MVALAWGQVGQRIYETGVDHGVLYIPDGTGAYTDGYAWSGLTTVTESPSGAESNKQYADNGVYVNLVSAEEFGGTIEAFTFPEEFQQCDGTASPTPGIAIGQQSRKSFGMAYRSRVGNDLDGVDHGYKLHLIYGALAAPSEKAYTTINDSPEAIGFSWEFTTTPVDVGTVGGVAYKPVASLTVDSTKVDADSLAALEQQLFGTAGTDAMLPTPAAVITMFLGDVTQVTPTAPTYNSSTKVITIPTVTGVVYKINGLVATGTVTITEDTIVVAYPADGYKFPPVIDNDWYFDF